jgi:hypothetical protein
LIVADDQGGLVEKSPLDAKSAQTGGIWRVAPALNNEGGMKRLREELPRIHIPQSEAGKPVKAQRHFKKFDDAFDCARAIVAQLPTLAQLTDEERINQRLGEGFRAENLLNTLVNEGYTAIYALQEQRHEIERDIEGERKGGRENQAGRVIQRHRDLLRK